MTDVVKRKRASGPGNLIFGTFLVCWGGGLYHAYTQQVTENKVWPPPFPFEDKLFALHKGQLSFADLFNGEAADGPPENDMVAVREWLRDHTVVFAVSTAVYVLMLVLGPLVMKNLDRPFWHKPLLTLWSLFLAAGSTLGAYRVVPSILKAYQEENGLHTFMCGLPATGEETSQLNALEAAMGAQIRREQSMPPYAFLWVFMFVLSKIPELVDTFFIILGKGNVRFLHWYHHITVLWFTWACWANYGLAGPLFAGMNLCVHSIMYTWYALAAADGFLAKGLKARGFSMMVTSIQIIQMIIGSWICFYLLEQTYNPEKSGCLTSEPWLYQSGGVMYGSYLILFVNLFITAYICPKPKKKTA